MTGRYATDPGYASKLNNIITTYGLTQYDTPASGNAGGGATTGGNNTGSTGSTMVQVILVIQTQVQQLRPLILFNLAILFGESPINSVLQWIN